MCGNMQSPGTRNSLRHAPSVKKRRGPQQGSKGCGRHRGRLGRVRGVALANQNRMMGGATARASFKQTVSNCQKKLNETEIKQRKVGGVCGSPGKKKSVAKQYWQQIGPKTLPKSKNKKKEGWMDGERRLCHMAYSCWRTFAARSSSPFLAVVLFLAPQAVKHFEFPESKQYIIIGRTQLEKKRMPFHFAPSVKLCILNLWQCGNKNSSENKKKKK